MAKYTFGVAALTGDKADWLVQNASKSTSAQEAMALNENGEPEAYHVYQKVEEMSFEVIIPNDVSESDIPAVGDVFQYGKDKNNNDLFWYVSSSQLSATNTDFQRYSLTAKRFVEAGKPANATDID